MSAQIIIDYADQIGNKSIDWKYENDDILCINNIKLKIIENDVIPCDDILSQHLVRLINLNNFEYNNFIFDLIMILNKIVPRIYEKCTICGTNILSTNCVDTCGDLECINQSLKLVTNNYVCDYFNRDENVFMLLIYVAYSCFYHPNADLVMIPFPKLEVDVKHLATILNYNMSNINKLIEIVRISKNDNELSKKIGVDDYGFLKFVLKTNNTNLISSKLFNKNEEDQTTAFSSNDVICYDVRHEPLLENKFGKEKLKYYFHGSSLANWYAILRHGLKNCSGTKLMANGDAYGSGIYLSNSASVSFSYGNDIYTRIGTSVVGVIQSIGDTLKDHHNNIFVEATKENLLLKYILLIKNRNKCEEISNYFTKRLVDLNDKYFPLVTKVVSKRLMHDSKEIVKIAEKYGWQIDSSINFGYTWQINVNNICILNVKFTQNYPINPPFIWLSETKYMTKDITKYGAIFLNELVPKNWIISTKIYKLIEKIILDLSEGFKVNITKFDYDIAFNDYSSQLKVLQLV